MHVVYLQVIHFKYKDTDQFNVKVWEKIGHANTTQQRAGIAIIISDKGDF